MGNKRIKKYWLILLLILMGVNLFLSVEPTQAHYLNTAVWNTVVEAEENVVTSKFLSKVSDAPLTVLVGDIPMGEYPVEFNLDCSRDVTGSLSWSVDRTMYVDVLMSIGDVILEPDSEIQLEMGKHTVTMLLIPSDYARNSVHDALDINVSVNWADSLQGKFRVTLPAVTEEEDLVVEPTEPESSNPGTDDPTTGTDDPTTGTDDPTTGTDDPATDTDSDAPSTGEEETASYVQTNVSENSANSFLVQSQAKKTLSAPLVLHLEATPLSVNQVGTTAMRTAAVTETKSTEVMSVMSLNSTVSTSTEASTEPASTEPAMLTTVEEEEPQFRLETIDGFNIGGKIPVKLYLTEDITQAYLGMGQTSDEGITLLPFPEYTCYSLDNGESYYMLYTDRVNTIELIPGGSKEITVLLDLSRLELFDKEELTLAANGFAGTTLAQSASAKTILKEDPFFQIDSQFLTQGSQITIALNENWKNDTFDYKVQMLTGETAVDPEEATEVPATSEAAEETSMPKYVDVDASLWSSLTVDEENYKITLQIEDVLPQAGTYRVLMNWSKDKVCFAETQTTFFVNYSVQLETDEPEATEPEVTEPEATEPESNEEKVPSSE